MPTVVVPTLGERTDPDTIQAIHDDLTALESDVATLETTVAKMVRLATTTRTSASSTFTAETVVDSVTASLVSGRKYRIVHASRAQSSVADGYVRGRIREDSISGTIIQIGQIPTTIAANQSAVLILETEFTAVASASKTFVATMVRQAGTGNITAHAATDTPV